MEAEKNMERWGGKKLTPPQQKKKVFLEKLTACQEIKKRPSFYRTSKAHYRVHKRSPILPVISQISPIYTILTYFNYFFFLTYTKI
jgi:hypothetical protein